VRYKKAFYAGMVLLISGRRIYPINLNPNSHAHDASLLSSSHAPREDSVQQCDCCSWDAGFILPILFYYFLVPMLRVKIQYSNATADWDAGFILPSFLYYYLVPMLRVRIQSRNATVDIGTQDLSCQSFSIII